MKPRRPNPTANTQARWPARARAGVTLVELVVALSLTTIVMAAATSVMFVASRALPKQGDASVRATDAALALAMLEAEAQVASRVRLEDDAVRFLVPDRTGDLLDDQIIYRWAGNAGDALTRTDHRGTSDAIASVTAATFEWTKDRGDVGAGTLYVTLTLERGLVLRSTVRFPLEPENDL